MARATAVDGDVCICGRVSRGRSHGSGWDLSSVIAAADAGIVHESIVGMSAGLGISAGLKHRQVLIHKLEVMPSRGPVEHDDVEAWRILAEAEIVRLRSLSGPQLGAEVMRRGFVELPANGERTQIGLSNSLCPAAPSAVGDDDIDLVTQYNGLLIPVLSALEDAGLLISETRGRSALRFYSATAHGRSALGDNGVETILATRASR